MQTDKDTGGPAFPHKRSRTEPAGDNLFLHTPGDEPGMTLRDYFAAHAVQPGCGEIASMAGLVYRGGFVWKDAETKVGYFDDWFCSLPLAERLALFSRVKFAMADAMLSAREAA